MPHTCLINRRSSLSLWKIEEGMGATPQTLLNLVLEEGRWKGAGRWTKGQFLNIIIDNIDFYSWHL